VNGWVLRVAGTAIDGQSRSAGIMEISRPDDLGDIANLGLALAEAKPLMACAQRGAGGRSVSRSNDP